MKKFALIAFVAISFATISCKEKETYPVPADRGIIDTLKVDSTEVPTKTADSVGNVTAESIKTDSTK